MSGKVDKVDIEIKNNFNERGHTPLNIALRLHCAFPPITREQVEKRIQYYEQLALEGNDGN